MLQEIKTKFGSIYMEQLGEQEEEERIKILDSNKNYMTYIDTTVFEEVAERSETTAESIHRDWCETLIKYETIETLVEALGLEYDLITTDWKETSEYLFNYYEEQGVIEQKLIENEWVNKIGEYYIVISEWR